MILLDTNVFSELMSEDPDLPVLAWVGQQKRSRLVISTILLAEIFAGIELKPDGRRKNQLRESAQNVAEIFKTVLDFDEGCAANYGDLMGARSRSGRKMSKFDCLVAAIALSNGYDLATRNVKDFEGISGLRVVNPWDGV